MANAVKEVVKEKIEVVEQPEETTKGSGFKFWLLISAVLAVAAAAFFVVRRFMGASSEE